MPTIAKTYLLAYASGQHLHALSRPLFFVTFSLLILTLKFPFAYAQTLIVKDYEHAFSTGLRPYLAEVLHEILEITKPEFGAYTKASYKERLSATRAKLITEQGEALNLLYATDWNGNLVDNTKVIGYDFSAFNDLLGLRELLITHDSALAKKPPKSIKEFLGYSAGQGHSWEDVSILRSAGIKIVEAQMFDTLFPMLEQQRFDYVPLSILEATNTLNLKQREFPNLTRHSTLHIFYPMNVKLYVNAKDEILNARVALGIKKMQAAGFESIFQKHFSSLTWSAPATQLLILQNPHLTPEENKKVIDRFLTRYGDFYQIMQ